MLATAGLNGATQALLSAHGFDASMIADLVNHGLATLTAEKVRAGGKLIAVAKALGIGDHKATIKATT